MKTLISLTIVCFLGACIQSREVGTSKGEIKPRTIQQAIIGDLSEISDPVSIESTELKGNILEITIHYNGGCKSHEFKLIGAAAISKSLPPRRTIQLVHHANDDTCQVVQTKNLQFNIEAFAYRKENGCRMHLDLEGYPKVIDYIFTLE